MGRKRRKFHVGHWVRVVRESRSLTREDLVTLLDRAGTPVHVNTIYRLETGNGKVKMQTIEWICKALGMSLEIGAKRKLAS